LESNGNDVANAAVAAEALLKTGKSVTAGLYRDNLKRVVEFILLRVEASPADSLAVTDLRGTQIQRNLGPFIDTFLAAKLLGDLDGALGDRNRATAWFRRQPQVRRTPGLAKTLRSALPKIEKNQLKDRSWNVAGGWAPIFGTWLASQSLAGLCVRYPQLRRA